MNIIKLWLLFICCLSALTVKAQEDIALPLYAQRITSLEEINDNDLYAIAGFDDYNIGENKYHQLVFLSSEVKEKRLKGAVLKGNEEKVAIENNSFLWKISQTTDGKYHILSVKENKYLSYVKANSTDLILSEDGKNSSFEINIVEGNGFSIPFGDRRLNVYGNSNNHPFGFYAVNKNPLYLYKLTDEEYVSPGTATMPSSGERLTLCAEGLIRNKQGKNITATPYLLYDDTLAPDDAFETYTVGITNSDEFTLKNEEGLYLNYDLTTSSEQMVWYLKNGHYATNESPCRYLAFDSRNKTWIVSEETAFSDSVFAFVAERPSQYINENGVCQLLGGWSAEQLSQINWETIRCLDLTSIALPKVCNDFVNQPTSHNTPIFISSKMANCFSNITYPFVVLCSEERNALKNNFAFTDKEEFYTDRTIYTAGKTLSYIRTDCPENVWQTVYLPFSARVVLGTAYNLKSINGEALEFEQTDILSEGVGYLILPNNSGTFQVQATDDAPIRSNFTKGINSFVGTLSVFQTTENDRNVYFLYPHSSVFKKTAAGSTLYPFRAYIQTEGSDNATAKSLRMNLH